MCVFNCLIVLVMVLNKSVLIEKKVGSEFILSDVFEYSKSSRSIQELRGDHCEAGEQTGSTGTARSYWILLRLHI